MSVRRKNARRLRALRRLGVRIDGDYRVTGTTVERLGLSGLSAAIPAALRPQLVDAQRDLLRFDPQLQRMIAAGLSGQK